MAARGRPALNRNYAESLEHFVMLNSRSTFKKFRENSNKHRPEDSRLSEPGQTEKEGEFLINKFRTRDHVRNRMQTCLTETEDLMKHLHGISKSLHRYSTELQGIQHCHHHLLKQQSSPGTQKHQISQCGKCSSVNRELKSLIIQTKARGFSSEKIIQRLNEIVYPERESINETTSSEDQSEFQNKRPTFPTDKGNTDNNALPAFRRRIDLKLKLPTIVTEAESRSTNTKDGAGFSNHATIAEDNNTARVSQQHQQLSIQRVKYFGGSKFLQWIRSKFYPKIEVAKKSKGPTKLVIKKKRLFQMVKNGQTGTSLLKGVGNFCSFKQPIRMPGNRLAPLYQSSKEIKEKSNHKFSPAD